MKKLFSRSFIPLNFKLISVNSLIMIGTMSLMILIATEYFKKDSELRIRENNVMITDAIGARVNAELASILQTVRFMVSDLKEKSLSKSLDQYDDFILSIGIYESTGYALRPIKMKYNQKILSEAELGESDIDNQIQIYTKHLERALDSESSIQNFSPGLKFPAFAISIPYKKEKKQIVIACIDYRKIRESFETKGSISETMLVNSSGNIIGHPDQNLIIKGENFYDLPVVREMFASNAGSGQIIYSKNEENFIGSYKKVGFAGAGVISIISKDRALEEVYNIQRRNIILMMIAILIVFFVVYNFAKQITRPVLHLVQVAREIQKGNFQVSFTEKSRDEIGLLEEAFLEMGTGLAEREKVKDALTKFVSKEIAEIALKGEIKLGGEQKVCVIFFSDIRGFTAMSEKMSPEEVVELLNEYLTKMVNCVNLSHGYVDKFIGDAIMATWGVPISKGNDAENAINGALMMRTALLEMNAVRKSEGKPEIKMGCGLNYGVVVAGQIGSNEKLQYTVIGDSVNLASRVESLNKPFGTDILITQDLYDQVSDTYLTQKMQQIKVKGKSEPQTIYAVLGRKDDPACPQSLEELRELVGIVLPNESAKSSDQETDEKKYELL